jgi:hypothetical protein
LLRAPQSQPDPADAFKGLNGVERIQPFTCFSGIAILTSEDASVRYQHNLAFIRPRIIAF